ncbi:MAG TPA: Uma2 family endonuclease [Thermomicrobiales bacterium]|jgi:Uma2 family endonuclease|nr:Uma2 family endonuclease [Thermomicrobiales bacterium]
MATLEDLDLTPDDGQTYEIIDGVIVVSPAPTWKHQATVRRLDWIFTDWVRATDAGELQAAPFDIVLREGQVLQPDLLYIASDNPGEIVRGRFHGVPDVCVEVVAPTSRTRDGDIKSARYASAGVPEFWLADPDTRSMAVYQLVHGFYQERAPDVDGSLASSVMAGVRVDPEALFDAVERSQRRFTRD